MSAKWGWLQRGAQYYLSKETPAELVAKHGLLEITATMYPEYLPFLQWKNKQRVIAESRNLNERFAFLTGMSVPVVTEGEVSNAIGRLSADYWEGTPNEEDSKSISYAYLKYFTPPSTKRLTQMLSSNPLACAMAEDMEKMRHDEIKKLQPENFTDSRIPKELARFYLPIHNYVTSKKLESAKGIALGIKITDFMTDKATQEIENVDKLQVNDYLNQNPHLIDQVDLELENSDWDDDKYDTANEEMMQTRLGINELPEQIKAEGYRLAEELTEKKSRDPEFHRTKWSIAPPEAHPENKGKSWRELYLDI